MSVMVQKEATRWSGDRTGDVAGSGNVFGKATPSSAVYQHAGSLGGGGVGGLSFVVGVKEWFFY